MRTCSHCGTSKSPCWRRGPPEKPLLCNACGAHYLVKKSLDGYLPGQRSSSVTTSSNSQHSQQRKRQRSSHKPLSGHQHQGHQHLQGQQHWQDRGNSPAAAASVSTASWFSAGSSMDQDVGVEVEQPAVVSSRKRSRLVACSVFEVDPSTCSVLKCKRTFETADGCIVTVVRRMRKQLKPRASSST